MTDLLQGQTAIVFGGTGHVGPGLCGRLAAEGATVVVHYYRNSLKAESIVEKIKENGGQALAMQADITDEEAVRALVAKTVASCGRLDIAVSGVHREFCPVFVGDMKWEDWAVHIEALKAHFNVCKSVLPQMRKQHYGRIVFISGGLSCRLFKGCAAFTAVKAGLNGFSKTLALEEGENGVTVNIVAPGRVTEEGATSLMTDAQAWESIEAEQACKTPLGRSATAKDVGDTVVYFASPLASFITGQTIFVTGGELMPMP